MNRGDFKKKPLLLAKSHKAFPRWWGEASGSVRRFNQCVQGEAVCVF